MNRLPTCLSLGLVAALSISASITFSAPARAADSPPEKAPIKPVVETLHGEKVTDPYRYLEKTDAPETQKFLADRRRHTRAWLDALGETASLRKEIEPLMTAAVPFWGAITIRPGLLFAIKLQPPKQQRLLVTLRSATDLASERVVADPNLINAKGTTAIDFYEPSPDGKRVAVSLSEGGSESGTVHVYETATGKELPDTIPRVNGGTAGGSVAWRGDGSGFYYTRYPHAGERPAADLDFYQQVYFHKMGTSIASDVYSIGKDFPRIAEVDLQTSPDGRYILATVANGDGGEYRHLLLDLGLLGSITSKPEGTWQPITAFNDEISAARFGNDKTLYLLSRKGAPRGKLLSVSLDDPKLEHAKTIIPEGEGSIQSGYGRDLNEGIVATGTRLYVTELQGGPARIRVFTLDGKEQKPVPILPVSSVFGLIRDGDDLLFGNTSYLDSPGWFHYSPNTNTTTKTALVRKPTADFSDIEVSREFATSKDGTRVPCNVMRKKGIKLDHSHPTMLSGYGGFGISISPEYSAPRRVLFDRGFVLAEANLRGGGEFGEAWHKAGALTHKQNVFDDFYACMKHLVDAGYTSPARLGIAGGSNGGLLMGAMIAQHPEAFHAVMSAVGIYDMVRYEEGANGQFIATEYGSVKDPEQFKALYAYSPYHHIKDGVPYPSVFFVTGDNDPRVDSWHSRKMAARLEAATSSKNPILLRTSGSAGHGLDTNLKDRISERVDIDAFFVHELAAPKARLTN